MNLLLIATLFVSVQTAVAAQPTCLDEDSCTRSVKPEQGGALLQTAGIQREYHQVKDMVSVDDMSWVADDSLAAFDMYVPGLPGVPVSSSSSDDDDNEGGSTDEVGFDVDEASTSQGDAQQRRCLWHQCLYVDAKCGGEVMVQPTKDLIACLDKCDGAFDDDKAKRDACLSGACKGVATKWGQALGKRWNELLPREKTQVWGCHQAKCVEGQCNKGAQPTRTKKVKKFLKKQKRDCEVGYAMEKEMVPLLTSSVAARTEYHDCAKASHACEKQKSTHQKAWRRSKFGKKVKKAFKAVKKLSKAACPDQAVGMWALQKRWCASDCAFSKCYGAKTAKLYKAALACHDACASENSDRAKRKQCNVDKKCADKYAASNAQKKEVFAAASAEEKAKMNKCVAETCIAKCKDFTERKQSSGASRRRRRRRRKATLF